MTGKEKTADVRVIVFEGPNRAGKTTLLNNLRETLEFSSPTITLKVDPPKTAREALEAHWSIMHSVRMTARKFADHEGPVYIYIDRLPWPSDMIYRLAMQGERSLDVAKHQKAIVEMLQEFNASFIYVTAKPAELRKRGTQLGSHHHIKDGEGSLVEDVYEGYEEFFSMHPAFNTAEGIPMVRLNTTYKPADAITKQAFRFLNEVYNGVVEETIK